MIKTLRISVYFYNTLFIDVSGEVDVTDASICYHCEEHKRRACKPKCCVLARRRGNLSTLQQLGCDNEVSINFHFCTIINTFQKDGNTLLPIQFAFKNAAESLERSVFNEDLFSLVYFWFLN